MEVRCELALTCHRRNICFQSRYHEADPSCLSPWYCRSTAYIVKCTKRVLPKGQRRRPMKPLILTEREQQVLNLVGKGANVQEIGNELHLSRSSAKRTLVSLYRKTGSRDKAQLSLAAHFLPISFPKAEEN